MLRDRPVRALTVGNLNIVCGIVTLRTVRTNFHHRSCARCARTGGTGHPLCQKRSMNTGLGQQGARRISVGVKLMAGVTHLKSER